MKWMDGWMEGGREEGREGGREGRNVPMCTMGPSLPAGRPLPTVKMTPTILQSMVLTRTTLRGREEKREG